MTILRRNHFLFRVAVVMAAPALLMMSGLGCHKASGDMPMQSNAMAPAIMDQPLEMQVSVPERATFSVTVEGEDVTYQWFKNDRPIPGATRRIYTTPPTSFRDDQSVFTVEVRNEYGTTMSQPAHLRVRESMMPMITMQPQNVTAPYRGHAMFRVYATGGGQLRYQWKVNGNRIPGANQAFYRTPPVMYNDNGDSYTVVVKNENGRVESHPAFLRVGGSGCCTVPTIQRFDTDDNMIRYGQSCRLFWNVEGAEYVRIDNGIGTVAPQGYMYVTPRRTTTYNLTARNQSGEQFGQVTVVVE